MPEKLDIQEFIRQRIIQLRYRDKDNIMSARELSIRINQNENYINQIEGGKSLPAYESLTMICQVFNISMSEFFDDTVQYPDKMKTLIDNAKKLNESELSCLIDVSAIFAKK